MLVPRRRALAAVLLGLAMTASACGSGTEETDPAGPAVDNDGDSSATTAPVTVTVPEASEEAAPTGAISVTDPAQLPTDMDGWEALWAEQRAAVVARIKEEGWGVSADGATLTGPEGFTIDLSACPEGWSDTEGITDTEIVLGQTLAQSGTLAYAANYGIGQNAVLSYYAGQGAFTDVNGKTRTVDYIQKDDSYDTAKTVPLVDELIDSEKVFGITTLGSPNTLKTYDKLNTRCIPHLFNQTGHPAWGDPVNHPWTTGLGLAYTTEAALWGAFIEERMAEFPDGVTVASLIVKNDFGAIYDVGFKAFLEESEYKDKINYVFETVDPQAPTITNQMTTLAAQEPDFFIAMVAGTFCTQAVIEAAQNGMLQDVPYLWQPNTCAGSTQLSREKVGGDGTASEGWWIVNGGNKDIRDPQQQEDPVVIWARGLIEAQGTDPDSAAELGLGAIYGWAWAQVLMIAGQLDGGLTRSNVILAARTIDMNNPLQLPGITFRADGNADSYYTEGGVFQQFEVAKQSYMDRSEVFNLEGGSKNCLFDPATGSCNLY